MELTIFGVGAVAIAVVFLVTLWGGPLASGTPGDDDAARSTAALRTLMRKGVLHLYTELGSPEAQIQAEERRIVELREWARTVPDHADRTALLGWLDYAEKACERSRASRIRGEEADRSTARMASY